MNIRQETEIIRNYVVNLRKHFHMYPELGMQEYETAKRIRQELTNMEIPYINVGETGIIGIIGQGNKVIALRADMDAIRVQEKNEVGYVSKNQGIMHACGHDAHMAALLGAAFILKRHEKELNSTVKLIFQPSEENCKGAKLITEAGHLDHVEEIFGLHVFGDIPCGIINVEEGPRMAASDIFKIKIFGKSGHAGKPHLCHDATVAGAALIMNLQSIVSREMDPVSTAVVTIGQFHAGSQHNVIAGEAYLEGTVRTFSVQNGKMIQKSIKRITKATVDAYNCTADIEYISSAHPAVINDKATVEIASSAANKLFPKEAIRHIPKMMLGEDFSIYQQRIPGTFAFVGAGNEELGRDYPNHHECFNIDEKAVTNATMLYVGYVMESDSKIKVEDSVVEKK